MTTARSALAAAIVVFSLSANAGGLAGALGGMGEALGRMAEQDAEFERQERLLRQQHEFEMQRIRLQIEAQRQANEEALARQAAHADARDKQARAKVEAAHPGWAQTVKTPQFWTWRDRQPSSLQAVIRSSADPDQIIMVLDLYKRDQR